MFITKFVTVTGGLLVVAALGGAGLVVGNAGREGSQQATGPIPRAVGPVARGAVPVPQAKKVQVDRWGDPLPPGAIARLGTVRFRTGGGYGFSELGFLADNKTVVSVTGGPSVEFWEAATGKLLREIRTDYIYIHSFALSPDSKYFAAQGAFPPEDNAPLGGATGIWETASGKKVRTMAPVDSDGDYRWVAFTADGKLLALESSSSKGKAVLRIEEAATGVELFRRPFPHRVGGNPAISPDGSLLVFAAAPNRDKFFLWKWQTAEEPREIKMPDFDGRPDYFGKSLAFSRDGKTLAECGDTFQHVVRLWDIASGRLLHKLEPPEREHPSPIAAVFSPDGKTLMVSTRSNTTGAVHIWDKATWKHLKRLELDREGGGQLAVSPDSRLLAGKGDGWLRVWDLASGKELAANEEAHFGPVNRIAVTGNQVVTASDDHTIRLWDATTGKQRLKLTHGHWVRALALSPDGTKVGSSSLDDTVCLWDVATGQKTYKLPGHGKLGGRRAVGFMPDGKQLLSWGDDMHLRKWDVATGKVVLDHALRPQGVKMPDEAELMNGASLFGLGDGTFSLDGKKVVLSMRTQFHVFDVATGKDLYQIPNEGGVAISLAISPDSRLFLASAWSKPTLTKLPSGHMQSSAARNHPISLWELSTRQLRKKVLLPDGGAGPVAFSPDNKFFAAATGEPDRRIRIWDMANGNEVGVIQGFRGSVTALAFAPDGERLISGMDDTTALVWDLKQKGPSTPAGLPGR